MPVGASNNVIFVRHDLFGVGGRGPPLKITKWVPSSGRIRGQWWVNPGPLASISQSPFLSFSVGDQIQGSEHETKLPCSAIYTLSPSGHPKPQSLLRSSWGGTAFILAGWKIALRWRRCHIPHHTKQNEGGWPQISIQSRGWELPH